jgi:hypothetical protein
MCASANMLHQKACYNVHAKTYGSLLHVHAKTYGASPDLSVLAELGGKNEVDGEGDLDALLLGHGHDLGHDVSASLFKEIKCERTKLMRAYS